MLPAKFISAPPQRAEPEPRVSTSGLSLQGEQRFQVHLAMVPYKCVLHDLILNSVAVSGYPREYDIPTVEMTLSAL